jgi:hypothetical protein
MNCGINIFNAEKKQTSISDSDFMPILSLIINTPISGRFGILY